MLGSVAVLLWGASILWTRIISESIGGLRALISVHIFVGTFSLLMWLTLGKGNIILSSFRSKWFYIRAGLACLNACCFYSAVGTVSPNRISLVILINYLWPTLTLVTSVIIIKIPIYRWSWFIFGSLLVIASISVELLHDTQSALQLVTTSQSRDFLAYSLAFVAALAWSLYSSVSRRWGEESGGPTVGSIFSFLMVFSASLLLPFVPQTEAHWHSTLAYWIAVAVVSNIVAFWCWDLGFRRGNLVLLSLFADTMPWISLGSVFLFLNTPVNSSTLWTALLLVVGAVITRLGTLRI